jgi:predicted TIM-barrel fold metal-dependent hydrolase
MIGAMASTPMASTFPIVDPDREVVDPHHHLWTAADEADVPGDYLLDDLRADTGTGHRVTRTVFVECGVQYRASGPAHLRPVGETDFAAAIAAASEGGEGATIAGIVAHADLTLPLDLLDELLDAHEVAAGGRLRGIRHSLASVPPGVELASPGEAAPHLAADPDFRRGVAHLGARGLPYESWHYHPQNREFLELARAVPDTVMVFDHFGTPLGVGPWAGRADEVFADWRDDVTALGACENVVAKLGGLAMPDNGFGWDRDAASRPDVEAFVAAQQRWYHHTIESFGPERCMFESNFPVDRTGVDYDVLWNAFKTMAGRYDEAEQAALLAGTAVRIYRL